VKFAGEALILNIAYAIYRYQRDRLVDHLRKLAALAEVRARFPANPDARDPTS
jgi:hypothetical protein